MKYVLQRLKRCELMQWAIAYLAAAWVVAQVLIFTADGYGWPRVALHAAFGLISLGFVVALVLAWYHGERGAQRVSGVERLLITLVLIVGGALMWQFVHARAIGKSAPGAGALAPHTVSAAAPRPIGSYRAPPPRAIDPHRSTPPL